MAATRRNDRRLSDEQLGELITLLKDVDTVELKLTVPQADQRAVVTGPSGRSPRGADPPGVLLRHAGSRAEQGRSRRSARAASSRRATTPS